MPNQYVNKVVQSNGTTLIDISDTTAVAADVASGKYFYLASGEKVAGTASGGGDSTIKRKSGSFTPLQTYNSTTVTNVELTTISDIGFTPTRFYLWVDKVSDLSQTRYAISRSSYESFGRTPEHVKLTTRYTNTSGTIGTMNNSNSWTDQSAGYLYTDGASVYFRAHSSYRLLANVKYNWIAEA